MMQPVLNYTGAGNPDLNFSLLLLHNIFLNLSSDQSGFFINPATWWRIEITMTLSNALLLRQLSEKVQAKDQIIKTKSQDDSYCLFPYPCPHAFTKTGTAYILFHSVLLSILSFRESGLFMSL